MWPTKNKKASTCFEDFDSRFNGRYLDSVINNVPHYTDDTVQIVY